MPHKNSEARKKYKRDYMRTYTTARYARDEVFRESVKQKSKKRYETCRDAFDVVINEFKKNGCRACGEKELCCLVAHHLNPEEKEHDIAQLRRASFNIERNQVLLRTELQKCVCLCHNCHSKVHAGVLLLEKHY